MGAFLQLHVYVQRWHCQVVLGLQFDSYYETVLPPLPEHAIIIIPLLPPVDSGVVVPIISLEHNWPYNSCCNPQLWKNTQILQNLIDRRAGRSWRVLQRSLLFIADGWVVGDLGAIFAEETACPILDSIVQFACALDLTAATLKS